MSRVSDMTLEFEEKYFTFCEQTVSECESIQEFRLRMHEHFNLVIHKDQEEIDEIVTDTWNEFWSKYNNGEK